MKILLDGSCEFIIGVFFIPNKKDGEIEYIDDAKKIAKGKRSVEHISFHVHEDNGYERPNKFLKVFLTKNDILRLAKQIEEIEANETTDEILDDLPF